MIFGYFTFFVALVISAVAEYYSIIGLTSIFAAAYWPVVIMGVALGVGKITAAVWLKLNWNRASLAYKLYLVPAVAFLMFLTSMGIFGFLSKSHSDLSLTTGDKAAQLTIYDEKIKILNENIETNRSTLKQLNEAVDQVMGRSDNVQGALKSMAIRKSQQQERKRLNDEIIASQQEISKIIEDRSVIAAEVRQVEAEVGPIKYIAALIYGNNPDAELLESAVRWVIILIVLVFDPLALCLMLAAQQSLRWAKEEKQKLDKTVLSDANKSDNKKINSIIPTVLDTNSLTNTVATTSTNQDTSSTPATPDPIKPPGVDNNEDLLTAFFKVPDSDKSDANVAIIHNSSMPINLESNDPVNNSDIEIDKVLPPILPIEEIKETVHTSLTTPVLSIVNAQPTFKHPKLEDFNFNEIIASCDYKETKSANTNSGDVEETKENNNIDINSIELSVADNISTAPQPAKVIVPQPPEAIAPKAKEIVQVPETIDRSKPTVTDLKLTADNSEVNKGTNVKAHFGITFPVKPEKGELFLRVDYLPTRLFKFNGSKWIEVNKAMTDSYVYNTEYIKFMIKEIDAGRLDPDDISPSERDQIADFLANDEQNNNPT